MVILTRKPKPRKHLTQKFTFFCCLLCTLLIPSLGISAYLASLIVRYVSGFKYFVYFFIIYEIIQFQFNVGTAISLLTYVVAKYVPSNIHLTTTGFYILTSIFYIMLIIDTFLSLQITYITFKWFANKRAKAIKSAINIMNRKYN